MAHITIRRGASALGASALIGLALAGPASARMDPGDHNQASNSSGLTAGDVRHHDSASGPRSGLTAGDIRHFDGTANPNSSAPAPKPEVKIVTVDSNTIEYLQVGAGALGGMALAGAGALVLSQAQRRRTAAV